MKKKNIGILLMILFAFSYSSMQVAVRMAGDVPRMEKVFVRNLMNMCLALYFIRKGKISFFGEKKNQPGLFARDIFSFLGMTCLFYASEFGKQTDVTILNKMSPFFITIFAVIFLKEELSKIQIPALILGFCGAYFVAMPTFNSDMLPLAVAFFSAITTGVAYTLLSYFKDKVNGMTVMMHFSTFCVIISGTWLFLTHSFVIPSGTKLIALLLVGVFGTMGQLCVTYGYRMAPASEISIYNYTGILFSMFMDYFVLNNPVGLNSIAGGVMVVIASLMVYLYNRKRSFNESIEKCT